MENIKLEDNIEDIYKEKRNIVKEMEILNQENIKFNSDLCEMTKAKDSTTKKLENQIKVEKNKYTDKKDMFDILESDFTNKCKELKDVRKSLKTHKMSLKVKMFKCLVNTSAVFATPNSEVGTL